MIALHVTSAAAAALVALINLPSPSYALNTNGTKPGPDGYVWSNPYYQCKTNYYVAPNGKDNNPGSEAEPWASLQRANDALPKNGSAAGTCINVEPGTYTAGVNITAGGNYASSTGYVTYRCTALDQCIINTTGNAFALRGNGETGAKYVPPPAYVIIDGFDMVGSSQQYPNGEAYGVGVVVSTGYGLPLGEPSTHHIWILNNVIHGFGQAGIGTNEADWMFVMHNMAFNNANVTCDAQGSGIGLVVAKATPNYTLTADDKIYAPFHQVVGWNITYDNIITKCAGIQAEFTGKVAPDSNKTGYSVLTLTDKPTGTIQANDGLGGAGVPPGASISAQNPNGTYEINGSFTISSGSLFAFSDYNTDGNGIIIDTFNGWGIDNVNYTYQTLVTSNVTYNNGAKGIQVFRSELVTVANNTAYSNNLDPWNAGFPRGEINNLGGWNNTYTSNVVVAVPAASPSDPRCKGADYDIQPAPCPLMANVSYLDGNLPGNPTINNTGETWKHNINLGGNPPFGWGPKGNVILNQAVGTFTCTSNKCEVNPLFDDVAAANFGLQSTSPAIGYGLQILARIPEAVDAGACYHAWTSCY